MTRTLIGVCVVLCSLLSLSGSVEGCEMDLNCAVDVFFPLKINCDIQAMNFSSALDVNVTYSTTEIEWGPVLSVSLTLAPDTTQEFSLYRLAPGKEYTVTATSVDPSLPCSATNSVVTGLTGDPQMDDGPLVSWNRTSDSSLDLIVYDKQSKYVAFDRTGWAVWYLDTGSVMPPQPSFAKNQNPDLTITALTNSSIARYTADNHLITEYYFPCDPEELSMLNHECTAPADDPYRVYVFQQMIIPNAVDSQGKAITEQVLSSWDSETNEFISICPTTDIYNPETQKGPMSSASLPVNCPGTNVTQLLHTTDWCHDNALTVPNDPSKLILSSRHLSAIAEIDRETCAVSWFVSTEISGGYTVPNEEDRWYNQHYAHQLPNGNFLMLDNGNDRPDPHLGSRALEIEIDHENQTASAVWQFAPGLQTMHAGVVTDLDNGARLVGFSCDVIAAQFDCDMLLWEVDIDTGAVITFANIVRSAPNSIGSYRADVWETINGEVIVA